MEENNKCMKWNSGILIVFLFGFGFIFNHFSQSAHPDYLDGVVFVKIDAESSIQLDPYDNSDEVFNQIMTDFDIITIESPFKGLESDTLDLTYKMRFQDTFNVDDLVQEVADLNWVDYVEKSPLYKIDNVPNDPFISQQWYLNKIEAFSAWEFTTGDKNIVISIVDNAVRITHEDLISNLWVNPNEEENGFDSDLNGYVDDIHGYDVADGNNDPNPPSDFEGGTFSHGSHCAGIASSATNNDVGIAGVGHNCSIQSVKCSPDDSDGNTLPYAYEGLKYAIDTEADIISMSWGSRVSSFTGDALINVGSNRGIVMFAAAGNNGDESLSSPASHPSVIAVGSTGKDDNVSSFSNFGEDIAFMAPGEEIYSLFAADDSDYGYSGGTSMACPIAAGIGGLVLSEFPNFTPEEVREAIEMGCDNIDTENPNYVGKMGTGRVNAGQTFDLLLQVQNQKKKNDFAMYPVPTKDQLNILINGEVNNIDELKVLDNLGRDVSKQLVINSNSPNTATIDGLSKLTCGVYFVRLSNTSVVKRIVVE